MSATVFNYVNSIIGSGVIGKIPIEILLATHSSF